MRWGQPKCLSGAQGRGSQRLAMMLERFGPGVRKFDHLRGGSCSDSPPATHWKFGRRWPPAAEWRLSRAALLYPSR